jgi:hypothetical protein
MYEFSDIPQFEKKESNYTFFRTERERSELFEYTKGLAEYIISEQIKNLVIVDRNARPVYIGVREYLLHKYPETEMPQIYFLNPKGFKAKKELTQREIRKIMISSKIKDPTGETREEIRDKEEIIQEFEDIYKRLLDDKNEPVLIFDTCIHSGDSLDPVKELFNTLDFSDVRIGAVTKSEDGSKVDTDFHITDDLPKKMCNPFSQERSVSKTFKHVYSKRTDRSYQIKKSRQIREEIKRIINDFLEKEEI